MDHRSPDRRPSAGPLSELLGHIPPASKLALTAGTALGLFVAIVLAEVRSALATPALVAGIAGGVVAAILLWRRAR